MAPDPRFALRSPKADEPIVLFPLPQGETALETVSALYPFALISLTLATFVGHADGTMEEAERRQIIARIDATPGLSASERARLSANLLWLIAVPPNLSALRSRLKAAPGEARAELGRIALATAAADGEIHPKEIAAIEKLYGVLGLDVDRVYSELHALSIDGPVSVYRPEALEIEHSIPSPPGDARRPLATVTLDATRIAAVMADTSRVSQVLGDIFSDDDGPPETPETDDEATETAAFDGLDQQHRALALELTSRLVWTEEEFLRLAAGHGLMAAGALEAINEWAFDRFGDALIEDYDGYEVNADIAAQATA